VSGDTLETLRTLLSARYRVERLLGSGGMATVYLAQDLKHDRPVAIKVLRPELAVALGPERFLREIQIAAKLNHPHILALHDSGEAGGLLYYVMPYVAGESLQEKVVREKQLSVEEALRITREVCAALAYAHGQGVIHRDIKPANILLSAGYALVADFGLARAISRASSSASITQPWLAVGTPDYMSPEQVSGEDELDGRSDLYSLGCVLYELLAGNPPFSSSNPGSTLLRQRSVPPAPIRSVRASVPGFVEGAISRALEKAPEDRFQSADELAAALREDGSRARPRAMPLWVTYGALGVAAVALVVGVWKTIGTRSSGRNSVDTTRYVILPLQPGTATTSERNVEQLVQAALSRWTGISVVDGFRVSDEISRRRLNALTMTQAVSFSRSMQAGRFIRGDLAVIAPDSFRIILALYDATASDHRLAEAAVRLGRDLGRSDRAFAALVDSLLLQRLEPKGLAEARAGTRSLPAIQAFSRGQTALQEWGLLRADSAFSSALAFDRDFALAALRLAQARMWNQDPTPRWSFLANQALGQPDRLGERALLGAQAIAALAREDYQLACQLWRGLTTRDAYDFESWYSLATCLRADMVVIRDRGSPTSWRFRSSYNEAVTAYGRAFMLHPSMHRGFRGSAFEYIRDVLMVGGSALRQGSAQGNEGMRFMAQPAWVGDSLLFTPYPASEIAKGRAGPPYAQVRDAVIHQRRMFHDIAAAWAAAYPTSPDALEAVAVSLQLLGEPSALDSMRRARQLATDAPTRARLGAAEAWFRLMFSIPNHLAGIRGARLLADSLLVETPGATTADPAHLIGLALLTGRGHQAARLARRMGATLIAGAPPAISETAPALVVFASLGGPLDSLEAMERQVDQGIETGVPTARRMALRLEWLGRAASLAFPDATLASLQRLRGKGDPLVDAQHAVAQGDLSGVPRFVAGLREQRAHYGPEDVSIDAILPEAQLLVRAGDLAGAAAWLDPALGALPRTSAPILAELGRAGTLVRAMALRADLADRLGDRTTSRRWARIVAELWMNADEFLQPVARRMASLGS
jgi:protein kinase-like protein